MIIREKKVLNKKSAILVLLLILMVFGVAGFSIVYAQSAIGATVNSEVAAEYDLNSEFTVPSGEITYAGKTKSAKSILHYPSGKTTSAAKAILTESGKYTVVYSAEFDGETVNAEKSFIVKYRTYSESDGVSVSYGKYKYDENINGLHVSIANGNKFVYNKVLDLKDKTKNDSLIRLYAETDTMGVADCESYVLTLTDVYDADNRIQIQVVRNPYTAGKSNLYLTYVNAKFPGQPYTSWYYTNTNGEYGKILYVSRFGTVVRFSFSSNVQYGAGVTYPESYLDFCYDYDEKGIYCSTSPKVISTQSGKSLQLIADFDDVEMFAEKWDGFTTGEVIMSLEPGAYLGSRPAGFFITKILGEDITNFEFADEVDPVITLFDDYGNEIPSGVKGKQYGVFGATYFDAQSGVKESGVKAYKDYGLAAEKEFTVYGGEYFIPSEAGNYTLEYSATDYFGNTTIKAVPVKVYDSAQEIFLAYPLPEKTACYVGEYINIPTATAVGGAGSLTVETTVTSMSGGESYEVSDGKFKPEKAGRYSVTYKATDYVGGKKMDGYIINVTLYDGAVFDSSPSLPKYFIAGFAYKLPDVYAYNYSSGEKVAVKASVKVRDANGTNAISGNYTPAISGDKASVTVTYFVGDMEQSYEIPCISTTSGSAFYKVKYFDYSATDVDMTPDTKGITVRTEKDLASFEFINQLLAEGFDTRFSVPSGKDNFNILNVYLTDSENATQQIKITVEKATNSTSYIRVNDGDKYTVNVTFGTNNDFIVKYNNPTRIVSDGVSNNILVNKTLNGENFDGFTSGSCYLSYEFEAVTGESAICIKSISGCAMNSNTSNSSLPEFSLLGSVKYNVDINETITIPTLKAASVLNPSVTCLMTVYLPNGNVATSTDGIRLENVSTDREYAIVGSVYGAYSVEYSARDSKGKVNDFSFAVTVVDREKPTINFGGGLVSVSKIGKSVSVPTPTVSDNLSVVSLIRCYKTPNGDIVYLGNASSFIPTTEGEYIIRFVAVDKFGNTSVKDFKLTVTR